MEAYNHVFDRDEKRALAQEMTNIMYRRPRFDYSADYFVKSYRLECIILRKQAALLKSILDNHVSAALKKFKLKAKCERPGMPFAQ